MAGSLYIIGTPIGNVADMTPRGIATLRSLDVLYCEDTRVSSPLLSILGVSVPLRSMSDDQPISLINGAIELVKQGKRVGFICDAGMPGVSDPARRLSRAAWEAGVVPAVIPGVSAVSFMLSACPFVDSAFCFAGFAGRRGSERAEFIEMLATSALPVFFFEGTSRVHALLDAMAERIEPERQVLLGREMTKLHEQLVLFQLGDWASVRDSVPARGEFTLAIAAAPQEKEPLDMQAARDSVQRLEEAGFSKRDAVKAYAAVLGLSTNEVKKQIYGEKPD